MGGGPLCTVITRVITALEIVQTVVTTIRLIEAAVRFALLLVIRAAVVALFILALSALHSLISAFLFVALILFQVGLTLLVGLRTDGTTHDGTTRHTDNRADITATSTITDATNGTSQYGSKGAARISTATRISAAATQQHCSTNSRNQTSSHVSCIHKSEFSSVKHTQQTSAQRQNTTQIISSRPFSSTTKIANKTFMQRGFSR